MDSIDYAVFKRWDLFKSTWRGVKAVKNPCDAWIYQELVWKTKPDYIVETGTFCGGGALFFASLLDMVGGGVVLTTDIVGRAVPPHDRIQYHIGSSIEAGFYDKVVLACRGKKAMFVLDSDHTADHVAKELALYAPLVLPGQYLIVEDTHWQPGAGGPIDAVKAFLRVHTEFEVDKECERFGVTNNPGGYLRRI